MDVLELAGRAWELLAALGVVGLHAWRVAVKTGEHTAELRQLRQDVHENERALDRVQERQGDVRVLGAKLDDVRARLGRIEANLDRKGSL